MRMGWFGWRDANRIYVRLVFSWRISWAKRADGRPATNSNSVATSAVGEGRTTAYEKNCIRNTVDTRKTKGIMDLHSKPKLGI